MTGAPPGSAPHDSSGAPPGSPGPSPGSSGAPATPVTTGTVIFPWEPIEGYALLDCGDGEKLEQVGGVLLRRPDPQAMWKPRRDAAAWDAADLRFVRESDRGGRWEAGARARGEAPRQWELRHRGATLLVRPTPFKHIGVFPEQSGNWAFTAARVAELRAGTGASPADATERPALLNLFGYTGAATVLATLAGAFVTHVDASRPALRWAHENAAASGLAADAVRWIEDDAAVFVRRERRRGRRYHGILLDPPPYGRGPGGETWTFEDHVADLLADCAALLADGPSFLVISCYAVGTTPLAFLNLLADVGPGERQAGELAIPEAGGGRLLPAGLCGRWWRTGS
jgi:23S rRNA (cytosine1962-C5)-methyltransferase